MINHGQNHINCQRCHFDTVCSTQENATERLLKPPFTIKRFLKLKAKEVLCVPERKFNHFYLIHQGAIKTLQIEANGKELIRGFYFANEVLGYEAIYPGHYHFSAQALEDTVVCEIPYEQFLKSVNRKPLLQKQALLWMSKQINAGSYLALSSAKQRLAAFLLDLSQRLETVDQRFSLPMSRQEIGNYLRLTAETVSRFVSKFKQAQLLQVQKDKIQLLELEQLQAIADGLI